MIHVAFTGTLEKRTKKVQGQGTLVLLPCHYFSTPEKGYAVHGALCRTLAIHVCSTQQLSTIVNMYAYSLQLQTGYS
jgi:hypothetical protein